MNIIISNFINYFTNWKLKCENSKYYDEFKSHINIIENTLNDINLSSEEKAEKIVEIILTFKNYWFTEIFDYNNHELELVLKYIKYIKYTKGNLIIDLLHNDIEKYEANIKNIILNNEILDKENLKLILNFSTKIYIKGECIINKLYDLQNETIDSDLFPLNYPWNQSFDDIMGNILFLFNEINENLIKNNIYDIININEINDFNSNMLKESENKNLNELFIEFENESKLLTDNINILNKDWNLIFKNNEFKELFELLKYSFNYYDNSIIKYFETQNNIDYKKFS